MRRGERVGMGDDEGCEGGCACSSRLVGLPDASADYMTISEGISQQ